MLRIWLQKSIIIGLFAGILLCASGAQAQIYTWVDDTGLTTFTDTLSNVPLEYLVAGKVKIVPLIGEPGARSKKSRDKDSRKAKSGEKDKKEEKKEAPKGPPPPPAEVIEVLKETLTFLTGIHKTRDKIVKFVTPEAKNVKYYVMPLKRTVNRMRALADKIYNVNFPLLEDVRVYLESTADLDELMNLKAETPEPMLVEAKARLTEEVPRLQEFMKLIKEELAKHEDKDSKGAPAESKETSKDG